MTAGLILRLCNLVLQEKTYDVMFLFASMIDLFYVSLASCPCAVAVPLGSVFCLCNLAAWGGGGT